MSQPSSPDQPGLISGRSRCPRRRWNHEDSTSVRCASRLARGGRRYEPAVRVGVGEAGELAHHDRAVVVEECLQQLALTGRADQLVRGQWWGAHARQGTGPGVAVDDPRWGGFARSPPPRHRRPDLPRCGGAVESRSAERAAGAGSLASFSSSDEFRGGPRSTPRIAPSRPSREAS
jgi:hypothetical protein